MFVGLVCIACCSVTPLLPPCTLLVQVGLVLWDEPPYRQVCLMRGTACHSTCGFCCSFYSVIPLPTDGLLPRPYPTPYAPTPIITTYLPQPVSHTTFLYFPIHLPYLPPTTITLLVYLHWIFTGLWDIWTFCYFGLFLVSFHVWRRQNSPTFAPHTRICTFLRMRTHAFCVHALRCALPPATLRTSTRIAFCRSATASLRAAPTSISPTAYSVHSFSGTCLTIATHRCTPRAFCCRTWRGREGRQTFLRFVLVGLPHARTPAARASTTSTTVPVYPAPRDITHTHTGRLHAIAFYLPTFGSLPPPRRCTRRAFTSSFLPCGLFTAYFVGLVLGLDGQFSVALLDIPARLVIV